MSFSLLVNTQEDLHFSCEWTKNQTDLLDRIQKKTSVTPDALELFCDLISSLGLYYSKEYLSMKTIIASLAKIKGVNDNKNVISTIQYVAEQSLLDQRKDAVRQLSLPYEADSKNLQELTQLPHIQIEKETYHSYFTEEETLLLQKFLEIKPDLESTDISTQNLIISMGLSYSPNLNEETITEAKNTLIFSQYPWEISKALTALKEETNRADTEYRTTHNGKSFKDYLINHQIPLLKRILTTTTDDISIQKLMLSIGLPYSPNLNIIPILNHIKKLTIFCEISTTLDPLDFIYPDNISFTQALLKPSSKILQVIQTLESLELEVKRANDEYISKHGRSFSEYVSTSIEKIEEIITTKVSEDKYSKQMAINNLLDQIMNILEIEYAQQYFSIQKASSIIAQLLDTRINQLESYNTIALISEMAKKSIQTQYLNDLPEDTYAERTANREGDEFF